MNAILQHFMKHPTIVSGLVRLEDDSVKEETPPPLQRVQRPVWEVLRADDSDIASRSQDGVARMMAVTVVACQEIGLTT